MNHTIYYHLLQGYHLPNSSSSARIQIWVSSHAMLITHHRNNVIHSSLHGYPLQNQAATYKTTCPDPTVAVNPKSQFLCVDYLLLAFLFILQIRPSV